MPQPASAKVRWPAARHLLALTCAWSLFVVYGSLTPFHFRHLPATETSHIVQWIIDQPLQPASRGDWITNCLLLMPFGYAGLGALLVDRDRPQWRWAAIGLMLALGLVLSVSVEVAQLWFPPRYPSKSDVLAQTLGNVAGMGCWILAGQWLIEWMRQSFSGGQASRAAALLQIYIAGLVVFSLLPLDLTIRPGDLWEKYKAGQIVLMPFANWNWDAAALTAALVDGLAMWPVGTLAAIWPERVPGHRHPIAVRWLAAIAFVALIEFAQVFVRSRFSEVTDLIVGGIAVSGGFCFALWWRSASQIEPWGRVAFPAACLAAVGLMLVMIYLSPFHFEADHRAARQRLAAMFGVPLEILRQGELLAMVTNVLQKLILFGIFGWLTGETAGALSRTRASAARTIIGSALAGMAVATAIEVAQAWFPPHVPEVTDILWGALGAALGAYVGLSISAEPNAR